MKQRDTGLHASTYYLPRIRSHADAVMRLKKTKPIRGRSPEVRDKYNPDVPTPCTHRYIHNHILIFLWRSVYVGHRHT